MDAESVNQGEKRETQSGNREQSTRIEQRRLQRRSNMDRGEEREVKQKKRAEKTFPLWASHQVISA